MSDRPKFTIIIPTYNRMSTIRRCMVSALNQTYGKDLKENYEVVVVDDGSEDLTEQICKKFARFSSGRMRYIRHENNRGRVAARNTGLKRAKGEWVVWLDSDDEFISTYLEQVARAIERYPEADLFTCGAAVYNDKNFTFHEREVFVPEKGEEFKSGKIGAGSFIFRRTKGYTLPECSDPYGTDDSFSAEVQKRVEGIRRLYGKNEAGSYKPLGNPWGDDYVMFYLLTRKAKPIGINQPLYIQHVRQ